MSISTDFLKRQVSLSRASQRSGDFISRSKNSISLSGKNSSAIADCTDKKKQHEIIIPGEENVARFDGDAVTSSDVYTASDNVVWDGDGEVKFKGPDGSLLSALQYDYINKHGPLSKYTYFGKSNNKDHTVAKVWRDLHRKSTEAFKDKGKSILYLTIGSLEWTREAATATKPADRVTSPLLLCPIESTSNPKESQRFLLTSDTVKINSILKRELTPRNMDVFYDIKDTVPIKEIESTLAKIAENAVYTPNVEVNINDMNICILDSTNESICQLIERNESKLAESPLIKVSTGEMRYSEIPLKESLPYPIYPLLADDTQRKVIEDVRRGERIVDISAAAGTGKSQTIANIAAMLAANNKTVLLLAEKLAGLEVAYNYISQVGLGKIALFIKSTISVAEVVEHIERIVNNTRVYLDPIRSRDVLAEVAEIEETLENYNHYVYDVIPKLDMTLYELIGDAIVCDAADDVSSISASVENYRYTVRKLEELQADIDGTIDEADFTKLIESGTTGDEETDELINTVIGDINKNGVDIIRFVKDNKVPVSKIASTVKANMARIIATSLIEKNDIGKCGNISLRTRYAKLAECYAKLKSLSVGFVQQQVGEMIAKAIEENSDFISMLNRLKTSRMTTIDFFKRYGTTVMKFCPIILTTPAAAVNYITDEMNTFDALLIDEASQVPIINVLPFLIGDRQLVAFGDNMQLDITSFFHSSIDDCYDENGDFDISRTDKSILHLVQGKGAPSKRLLYHYRSKTQHLITVSNKLCYNGNLNVVPDVYTGWDMLPDELGFELNRVDVPFDPKLASASAVTKIKKNRTVIEYPYLEQHEMMVEEKMAQEIAQRVAEIREEYPDKSIGVVTLNDHFQNKIIDALEDHDIMDYSDNEESIFVRSLENAQGREADVIIIAIEHAKRNVRGDLTKNISGFFNGGEMTEQSGNNRLNVLFTRAREKNIIYVAFDYKEIKDTERSLKRLFTYLEYAATGNMSCVSEPRRTVDRTNEHAAHVIEKALDGKTVKTKIGEGTLMVDLGIIENADADKYDMSFILPDRPLTPNELYTKINLLERAGWKTLPISLVYLLDNPEIFGKQLPKMMKISETTKLGCMEEYNYLTDVKPKYPVTLEEIATRGNVVRVIEEEESEEEKQANLIRQITLEEFSKLDVEAKCRSVCVDDVRFANQAYLEAHFKTNYQAFLIKLAQNVHKYAVLKDMSKIDFLTSKVYYLYKNLREKRACYLLAELTRLKKDCEQPEIQEMLHTLFDEAISMNIITEVT